MSQIFRTILYALIATLIFCVAGLIAVAYFVSDSLPFEPTKKSTVLKTSRGETIYIKTINWGMTDDHQLTSITKDANKFNDQDDTLNTISGLQPFMYKFNKDTLHVIYRDTIFYKPTEKFNSLVISYKVVDRTEFDSTLNQGGYQTP